MILLEHAQTKHDAWQIFQNKQKSNWFNITNNPDPKAEELNQLEIPLLNQDLFLMIASYEYINHPLTLE